MGSVAATFGLVIMVMIYATGHIFGAHFNPAVTLAFALTRHFPKREIAPYILAQCAGAVVASYVHVASLSSVLAATQPKQVLNLGVTLPVDGSFVTALVWEFMLTFLLMLVIMSMATDFRAVGPAAGLPMARERTNRPSSQDSASTSEPMPNAAFVSIRRRFSRALIGVVTL